MTTYANLAAAHSVLHSAMMDLTNHIKAETNPEAIAVLSAAHTALYKASGRVFDTASRRNRTMTKDQIERTVERRMNALDYQLITKNTLTQAQYDIEVKKLNDWAELQYAKLNKPAKRYQVENTTSVFDFSNHYSVIDTWTKQCKGDYATESQAQARARTLNSRNGGK